MVPSISSGPTTPMMSLLRLIILLAIAGKSLAILAGFLGLVHPAFDTLAHFRLHLAAGLILVSLGGLMLRMRMGGIAGIAIAALAIASAWQALPIPRTTAAQAGPVHRLLFFNMRFDNPQPQQVTALIGKTGADILLLTEYSRIWEPRLTFLKKDYPYYFHCPEWREVGGTVMFSKFPIEAENRYCHDYAALGLVRVNIGDVPVTIASAHMRWPWPASGPRQLKAITQALREIDGNVLMAGDFNATVWSHHMHRLAELGGLTIYPGIGPTWIISPVPASLAKYAGLPIDNVLSKGDVRIVSARTLEPAGSDHLPVLVEFTTGPQ
jgi:endonuclease/exonuclease/phosphatase (EEP) superfamily protein YafD